MPDPSAISMRTPRSATGLMDSICSPRYNPRRPRRSRTNGSGRDRATGRTGSRGAIPGSAIKPGPTIKKVYSDDESQFDPRDHRSEEHTSELQSLMRISYAVFCLKKKKIKKHKSNR